MIGKNKLLTAILCMASFGVVTAVLGEDYNNRGRQVFKIDALPTTGVNDLCGSPLFDFPFRFTFVGEYDPSPNAIDALPLTQESCANNELILATTTDPDFQAASVPEGIPLDASSLNKNLPLNRVPTIININSTRGQVPFRRDVPLSPVIVNGVSKENITLDDWFAAKATAILICRPNGTARLKTRFKNLVPNGIYTMWEIWRTTTDSGGVGLAAVPVGGVPNVFVANGRGFGRYARELSGCPMTNITPEGATMAFIDVVYHSDGGVTGGLPGLGGTVSTFIDENGAEYESTLPVGTISHTQLVFPMIVDEL